MTERSLLDSLPDDITLEIAFHLMSMDYEYVLNWYIALRRPLPFFLLESMKKDILSDRKNMKRCICGNTERNSVIRECPRCFDHFCSSCNKDPKSCCVCSYFICSDCDKQYSCGKCQLPICSECIAYDKHNLRRCEEHSICEECIDYCEICERSWCSLCGTCWCTRVSISEEFKRECDEFTKECDNIKRMFEYIIKKL